MQDFKSQSLELYGSFVQIELKAGSSALNRYGSRVSGKLTGRTWGDTSLNDLQVSTVVALTIETDEGEIHISCDEIHEIHKLE
ncbi:MAG: hypothetical protein ACK40G_00185 [Cytophagaceae bacterium]